MFFETQRSLKYVKNVVLCQIFFASSLLVSTGAVGNPATLPAVTMNFIRFAG